MVFGSEGGLGFDILGNRVGGAWAPGSRVKRKDYASPLCYRFLTQLATWIMRAL